MTAEFKFQVYPGLNGVVLPYHTHKLRLQLGIPVVSEEHSL